MPARTVLDMATRGGAAAMGGDGGTLAVGRPADCIALDLSAPNMQPLFNAASHAVYAATGMEVALTMVAGEVLYRDGRFSRFDYPALCAEVREMRRFVLRRLGLSEPGGLSRSPSVAVVSAGAGAGPLRQRKSPPGRGSLARGDLTPLFFGL